MVINGASSFFSAINCSNYKMNLNFTIIRKFNRTISYINVIGVNNVVTH